LYPGIVGPSRKSPLSDRGLRGLHLCRGFPKVAIAPRPNKRWSAVTNVRPSTAAVAAKKRSAGSWPASGNSCATTTISCVSGASRMCTVACVTQSRALPGNRIRPFEWSKSASHELTGDCHSSLSWSFNSCRTHRERTLRLCQAPNPNVSVEEKFQFFRASIASASTIGDTMSPTISIVSDMEPIQLLSWVSEDAGMTSAIATAPGDSKRRFCLANFFQQRQAFCLKLGDRNFLHRLPSLARHASPGDQ
jgi:hypothetical protein